MNSFDYQPLTRFVFGPDQVDALGGLALELGAHRVLVVSDPGIMAAGHTSRGVASLRASGIDTMVFDGVCENPTTVEVEAGKAVAADYQPDLIVGLGGGSSMDCAKGINFLHTNGGRMQDYWGVGKAHSPMLPMIAVPTTAGTGSEAQSFALISDPVTRTKMACGDKRASFRLAILDPNLLLTQPHPVAVTTGIDAISHALETYVTNRRTPISDVFSREAWRLLSTGFPGILEDASDVEAWSNMQLGACYAGLAIENSMLGAAHALANPLTANYQVVHGQAVGLMLPHVVRFNAEAVGVRYVELANIADGNRDDSPERLVRMLTNLLSQAGLKTRLSELDVDNRQFEQLAQQAAEQWTSRFNPRPVDESQLRNIYESAW